MSTFIKCTVAEKPVIELEGTRAQVDMFEGLSPEAQEQSLVAVLDSIIHPAEENQSEVLQEWFTSWKQGNVEEFAKASKQWKVHHLNLMKCYLVYVMNKWPRKS